MNIFIDDFIETLPADWKYDRFKDVATLRNEKTNTATEEKDYLELEDIESGTGKVLSWQNTLEVESAVTLFQKGDILFGKLRPYLEKYYEAEIDGKCTGEILAFKPERIFGRFLYYCLGSRFFVQRCNALAYGAKMPRVNWTTQLAQFNFPLPPLSEQEHIAAYLDKSCAAIDVAVQAKRSQIETLEKLKQSQINRAITKGLDESVELKDSGLEWLGKIPVHWAIKRIKDISELKSGDGIEAEEITPEGEYPVYGGNGLRGYTTAFTHDGYYVLIGRQGALCGNINYAEGKFWATEHAVVATLQKRFDRFWYGELLRVMNLNQYSNAAAQPGLAVDRIRFLRLPVPPFEEQTRIAEHVKNVISRLETIISNLEKQVDTLIAYRKSLIHECVTGQRRVTEADLKQV